MELLTILPGLAGRSRARVKSAFSSVVLAALCAALAAGTAAAADNEAGEYAVKAAYLSKFGRYVEWPGATFSSPGAALTLCIAGEDPFGSVLDKVAADESIGGRPIAVRRLKTVGRDSGCHILYVGGSDRVRTRQAVEAVRGSGVLTVSDVRGMEIGAIINFVIKDNRVRFDIDEEAALQNEIAMSSKLLSLALNVKRRQSKEAR